MARNNSRRKLIEEEIARRMEAGESLAVRAIIGAVGGSATTVLNALKAVTKDRHPEPITGEVVSAALPSGAPRQQADNTMSFDPVLFQQIVEAALKTAVDAQLSTLQKDLKGAVAYSMDKAEYGYQRMMEIADAMKHLFNDVASGKVPLTQPKLPRPSAASPAAVAAVEVQSLQAQIIRLSKQKEFLLRVISNSEIEADLDGLEDIR